MKTEMLIEDSIRLGWALFHFIIVTVFIAGLYLCLSLWRVSGGHGFKVQAPILWDRDVKIPLGDEDSGSSSIATGHAPQKGQNR